MFPEECCDSYECLCSAERQASRSHPAHRPTPTSIGRTHDACIVRMVQWCTHQHNLKCTKKGVEVGAKTTLNTLDPGSHKRKCARTYVRSHGHDYKGACIHVHARTAHARARADVRVFVAVLRLQRRGMSHPGVIFASLLGLTQISSSYLQLAVYHTYTEPHIRRTTRYQDSASYQHPCLI